MSKKGLRIILAAILLSGLVFSASAIESAEKELVSMRGENIKQYMEQNGQVRAEVFTQPIHFKDDLNEWEEIDTSLVDSSDPSLNKYKKQFFSTEKEMMSFTALPEAGVSVNALGKIRLI
jgi:uncharacterized protein (DUF2141 family)